jgi:hypothetical protein
MGGMNKFSYLNGRPLVNFDPTGLAGVYDFPIDPELERIMAERRCARGAFLLAYWEMRRVNWKKSDKYFHCKANCQAAKCGDDGYEAACDYSDLREETDQLRGDTPENSAADQVANRHGREGAIKNPGATCQDICKKFRPAGLPERY